MQYAALLHPTRLAVVASIIRKHRSYPHKRKSRISADGAIRFAIAPYSIPVKLTFGELDAEQSLPTKFAEAFAFGRENPTWTSDLVMSSPDGESGRPVGKGEC